MQTLFLSREGTRSLSGSTLVLGASGFLGSNLAHYLEEAGEKVTRAGRTRSTEPWFSVSSYAKDKINRMLDLAQPSAILNCVGVVGHAAVEQNPALAHAANVALPALLAKIALERGIKFVHFSSDSVYSGRPEEAPFGEDSVPTPFSLYGKQKAESEALVFSENPHSLVLRVNFFGWSLGGDTGMLDYFVSRAMRGRPAIGYSNYSVSSLHTKDLARIVSRSTGAGIVGTYNVGSRDSLTKFEFGRKVYQLVGADSTTLTPGNPSSWKIEGTQARDLSMLSTRLEQALSLSIPSQREGISESFSELRGYLEKYNLPDRPARARRTQG